MAASEFESFYTAHYGDTVAMTYGFTADLGAAQDIAQEAFCRAWQRWRDVSTYDNPVAWVRRVATNLAHSRWRRLRMAATYLVRERPAEAVPGIDPDHVAVVTALRKLPAHQRQAVVLHHLMDMPVSEVAEQLDVPVGTVKSWLHRGRTALAEDLRIDVRGSVTTPPAREVVALAKRHQRVRRSAVAAIAVAATAGAFFAFQLIRPELSPVPPIVDPIRQVDWRTVTVDFGAAVPQGCPSGRVAFTAPPTAGRMIGPADGWPKAEYDIPNIAIGDLTGDGRAEAALAVFCRADDQADDQPHHLVVLQALDDGSLRALGWTGRPASLFASAWISDGVLHVDARPHPSSQTWQDRLGDVDGWRWDGSAFVSVPTDYPGPRALDFGDIPCPHAPATLDDATLARDLGWQVWAELGRAGRPYLALIVECDPPGRSLVIFDRDGARWRALDAVPAGDLVAFTGNQVATDTDQLVWYTWDGDELIRQY